MRFIVALLLASLFIDKADSELSFIPRPKACIHALHISLEFAPSNIAIPTLSRKSHNPLIHYRLITAVEQLCASSRGKTEDASVIRNDWA
ncbi:hypothetical protein KSP40_PGU005766 [Platanthera guangdongensis]|uniref:Secreted protein n=1 Tax=Platanthera guangdongensis TaxID=2320717 RepID=A0ABR2LGS9_9ASPA